MQGLVTTERSNLDPAAVPFAKNPRDLEGLSEGASVIEVVNATGFVQEKLHWLSCYLFNIFVIINNYFSLKNKYYAYSLISMLQLLNLMIFRLRRLSHMCSLDCLELVVFSMQR